MTAVEVVERQLVAYNAQDLDAFARCYAEGVRLSRDDGAVFVEGLAELRATYGPMFSTYRATAQIVARLSAGCWVVDEELVHGLPTPVHALAVYRVEEELIRDVRFLKV